MGLLDRFLGRQAAPSDTALALHAGDTLNVVGESYRQDLIARVAESATDATPYLDEMSGKALAIAERYPERRWFRAVLFREPKNPHDTNAIAVHADGFGLVGYLSRDDAISYGPAFEELARQGGRYGSCPAFLTGGELEMSWGVVLALSSPTRLFRDLQEGP
jgi:hypothetical protein